MKSTKEKLLEEFDKLTPYPDDCGNDYDEQKEWLEKNNHLYHNEVYNEPMYDLSEEKVKEFIEKAIDKTREETIRKVEEAFYKTAGKYFLTQNMPIKNEKNMYLNKIEFWKLGVLDILNKLKK